MELCNKAIPLALKIFADLIDALGKVLGGLKAIDNLPKAGRVFHLCHSLRLRYARLRRFSYKTDEWAQSHCRSIPVFSESR